MDTEANAIHITSAEKTDFANVSSVTLGNSTSLSIGAPFLLGLNPDVYTSNEIRMTYA